MKKFRTIRDIKELRGKRVLVRIDMNVPILNGTVADDFRLIKSLPTLTFLKEQGAKIIIAGHIEADASTSLVPVAHYMRNFFNLIFIEKPFTQEGKRILDDLQEGEVAILENLRLKDGEKKNDPAFARELASLADVYVNEAFSVSHRKHASIVEITKHLPSYAGLLFEAEVKNLSKAFEPIKPFVFMLGGAKFDTKLPLIQKFMKTADYIFIGGALANDIFVKQGFKVGRSRTSDGTFDIKPILESEKLVTPIDLIVEGTAGDSIKHPDEVIESDRIVDAGPQTLELLGKITQNAKTIIWNGPLGCYEDGYKEGTQKLASMLAEGSGQSILGGGDTIAAIRELKLEDKFTFVSTGGGATLDFLANETLPGIEALKSYS